MLTVLKRLKGPGPKLPKASRKEYLKQMLARPASPGACERGRGSRKWKDGPGKRNKRGREPPAQCSWRMCGKPFSPSTFQMKQGRCRGLRG